MIELDGSYGEGGGALVRVALALSALSGEEFKVENIRAGREKDGLKAQHVAAIKALKKICNAQTNEVDVGSTSLWFKPGKIKSGRYEFDIGTAGSITLFLQAIILPCLFAPAKVTITIKGGTCGKWQASVDYLQNVLLPLLRRFVEKIELRILKRGYYPQGGGEVVLEISPRFSVGDLTLLPLLNQLNEKVVKIRLEEQGILEQIRGVVNVSSELEEKQVAERIKSAAINGLNLLKVPVTIRAEYNRSLSIGGEVVLWAVFSGVNIDMINPQLLGSDALIEKNKSSEEVAQEAVLELKEEIKSGASVDTHLADQLIPFMGLLPESIILVREVSDHVKTNIYVVEKFLKVQFEIENDKIKVKGL
jgi:RNA 3'-phosphate cyclase